MTRKKVLVNPEVALDLFVQNQKYCFSLNNKTCDWVDEVLKDLEKSIRKEYSIDKQAHGDLQIGMEIVKKTNHLLQEHLIIRGNLKLSYYTPCVRCLDMSRQSMEADFSVCYIHESKEKDPEYDDIASVFCDEEEMDLYFYNKSGKLSLKELVHEHIYLGLNRFPLHHEDCKGLCPTCGVNLNYEKCSHSK